MANEVNRIQVAANYQIAGLGKDQGKQSETKKEDEAKIVSAETKKVDANEVLSYMNAQSISIRPKDEAKVLDVSKYVTPEQAQRIYNFVAQFEEKFVNYFNGTEEFPLSEEARNTLALGATDRDCAKRA